MYTGGLFAFGLLMSIRSLGTNPCVHLHTAAELHSRMAWSVVGAPLVWFETTPAGHLIRRFGRDIDLIDIEVSKIMRLLVFVISDIVRILLLTIYIAWPILFILPILFYFFWQNKTMYSTTAHVLKRLDAILCAPILMIASETFQGIATIQSFRASLHFTTEHIALQNAQTRPFYLQWFMQHWLSVRTKSLVNFVTIFVAELGVLMQPKASLCGICDQQRLCTCVCADDKHPQLCGPCGPDERG
jgi:ABC-type multidrug transport system fused ATPase/permease subunit